AVGYALGDRVSRGAPILQSFTSFFGEAAKRLNNGSVTFDLVFAVEVYIQFFCNQFDKVFANGHFDIGTSPRPNYDHRWLQQHFWRLPAIHFRVDEHPMRDRSCDAPFAESVALSRYFLEFTGTINEQTGDDSTLFAIILPKDVVEHTLGNH